mmetsp:Transcript_2358/g.5043  ORF Transcript_2358/g.5043 Transcript_2358/m.5043 type:complete len:208 (+) Transcript_2358:128-751(+)
MSEQQEPFLTPQEAQEDSGDDLPRGKWRDGLCDFFSHCGKPVCLKTWFCSPCLLGQVMSRSGLDVLGRPTSAELARKTSCRLISFLITYYVVVNVVMASQFTIRMACPGRTADDFGDEECVPVYEFPSKKFSAVFSAVNALFGLYFLLIIIRTRAEIRMKSGIDGSCFGDFFLAWCCDCCVIGQMARHTADYDEQDDRCCTFNGLAV